MASQLFELDLVEPTPEVAATFLGINRADLSDPTLRFTTAREVYDYEGSFKRRQESDYRLQHGPAAQAFGAYMEAETKARTKDPDPEQLAKIEAEIVELRSQPTSTQTEFETVKKRAGILQLRHMAHKSGLVFPLVEFAATVLSYEDEAGFTRAERADALDDIIEGEIIDRYLSIDPGDVPAGEIAVGQDLHRSFAAHLGHLFKRRAAIYAEEQWDRIEPLLIAPRPEDHPLFAGNEQ